LINRQIKYFRLISLSISLLVFFGFNLSLQNKNILNDSYKVNQSNFIEDEIEPYCDGIGFNMYSSMQLKDIENLKINFINKGSWYENLFSAIQESDEYIFENRKKRYQAQIEVLYNNGIVCTFDAGVRISGDFQDHIRMRDLSTSLDVHLDNGHINSIVKFKLFLPETRRNNTELIVTTILNKIGFLTPRTTLLNASVNNQSEITYIFQEKLTKEFVEYNSFREGPLLETSEEFYWENRNLLNSELPILFGKNLNSNWSNRSTSNIEISLNALNTFNSMIFASDGSLLNYNNFTTEEILLFDTAMYALDGSHGLALHNRKFFYDNLNKKLLPIYYDSDSQIALRDTEFPNCLEEDLNVHQKNLCQNNFSQSSNVLLEKIFFDSQDIYDAMVKNNIDVSYEEVSYIFDKFLRNLNKIASIESSNQTISNNYLKSFKENYLKNVDNKELGFYFLSKDNKYIQFCNLKLEDCITENNLNRFQISEKIEFNGIEYYLLGSIGLSLENSSVTEYFKIDEEIYLAIYDDDANVEILDEKKLINIKLFSESKAVFFGQGTLNDWKVNITDSENRIISETRQDSNSLTGCVTFLNLQFESLNISSTGSRCEDALNFIGVSGNIKKLKVNNSYFDGIDFDFSNIKIEELSVANSRNDCIDFSYTYAVLIKAFLKGCSDKGVSIGEKSSIFMSLLEVEDSRILVAIKDSSDAEISELIGFEVEMCVAMYRKKQEFGPSKLSVKSMNCKGLNNNFIQIGQEFDFED